MPRPYDFRMSYYRKELQDALNLNKSLHEYISEAEIVEDTPIRESQIREGFEGCVDWNHDF